MLKKVLRIRLEELTNLVKNLKFEGSTNPDKVMELLLAENTIKELNVLLVRESDSYPRRKGEL